MKKIICILILFAFTALLYGCQQLTSKTVASKEVMQTLKNRYGDNHFVIESINEERVPAGPFSVDVYELIISTPELSGNFDVSYNVNKKIRDYFVWQLAKEKWGIESVYSFINSDENYLLVQKEELALNRLAQTGLADKEHNMINSVEFYSDVDLKDFGKVPTLDDLVRHCRYSARVQINETPEFCVEENLDDIKNDIKDIYPILQDIYPSDENYVYIMSYYTHNISVAIDKEKREAKINPSGSEAVIVPFSDLSFD